MWCSELPGTALSTKSVILFASLESVVLLAKPEAGDLDLVHARVQVPDAARALLRRARHAVVEAVDRTNNRDPRQLRSTEREREREERAKARTKGA